MLINFSGCSLTNLLLSANKALYFSQSYLILLTETIDYYKNLVTEYSFSVRIVHLQSQHAEFYVCYFTSKIWGNGK